MLRDLAYEPEDVSKNKTKDVYKIISERNGWKVFINISLSTDQTTVWFEAKFAPVAEPGAATTDAWLRLLQLSAELAPAHFALDATNRMEGDTMSVCVANPGVERPTEFKTTADFEGMLLVLKKQR